MTGYIKPAEIYEAQKDIIHLLDEVDEDLDFLRENAREFMERHPVTKKKEGGSFRFVNGVYVTEEAFQDSNKLERPMDNIEE